MVKEFFFQIPAILLAPIIFFVILAAIAAGFRYKHWLIKKHFVSAKDGMGPIEGSLLGLMALMMAFTFSLAAAKFETRRELVVEEANDIGTAILRCDMYSDSIRKLLMVDFAAYVEARIAYYDALDDNKKINEALQQSNLYSSRIWNRVIRLSDNLDNRVRSAQMIPAVNAMIDIVSTRKSSRDSRVPPIVFWMLFMLTLTAAFLVGYGNSAKRENMVMVTAFALMIAMAFYLIFELDRPRRGIINLDAAEQSMVQLRTYFTQAK
jgi:hypothetical protein